MTEFISIINNDIGGNSPNETKRVFDKEFEVNELEDYNDLYKYCNTQNKNNQVYICKDNYLSLPIISGINENYMTIDNTNFTSDLKILYFCNYHDLDDYSEDKKNNSILGGLLGISKTPFNNHKLNVKPDQVILIGLNDEDYDLDLEGLSELNLEYYTLSTIKKKGFKKILDNIFYRHNNTPFLCNFNMEVFNKKIAPSVNRRNLSIESEISLDNEENTKKMDNGLDFDNLTELSNILKNKIKYLIITGYDSTIDNETKFLSRLTSEVVQILYRNIMDLKEKKINIFNENSRFLIYRKLHQESEEDIGWYILRFLTMEDRQRILEKIMDDKIYNFDLNDYLNEDSEENNDDDNLLSGEILISATTMDDQNNKSYYHAKSMMDCTLYPQEKFLMAFELVNF